MHLTRPRFVVLILLGGLACLHPAHAAESYDNCTGFINSLPTVITTQGVWCLNKNLSTAITSGSAIEIAANNVTIDCNDFKIGGLAAGNNSSANGIYAVDRQNATIRHCNVRGFFYGIRVNFGAGHLVEDNRLDNNLYVGIEVAGDNNLVQRNRVYDTGGKPNYNITYGIYASANLVDNTVSGLFADAPGGSLTGISALGEGARIQGNRVSGFDMTATQGGAISAAYGIYLFDNYQRTSGNQVSAGGPTSGTGILAFFPAYCVDNSVGGFTTNIDSNCTGSGNETRP